MLTPTSETNETHPFEPLLEEVPDMKTVRNRGRKDGRSWRWQPLSLSSPVFREQKSPVPSVHQEEPSAFEVELRATAKRLRRETDERAERHQEELRGELERIRVRGGAAQKNYNTAKEAEQRREAQLETVQDRLDEAPRPQLKPRAMYTMESITGAAEGVMAAAALHGVIPLVAAIPGGLASGAGVAFAANDLGKRANKSERSAWENIEMAVLPLGLAGYVYWTAYSRQWYVTDLLGLESAGFTGWLFMAISAVLIAAAVIASFAGHTPDLEYEELVQKEKELEEELETLRDHRREAEQELVDLTTDLRRVENTLERLPQRTAAFKETIADTAEERIEAYRTANLRARTDGIIPRCWRSSNGSLIQ